MHTYIIEEKETKKVFSSPKLYKAKLQSYYPGASRCQSNAVVILVLWQRVYLRAYKSLPLKKKIII